MPSGKLRMSQRQLELWVGHDLTVPTAQAASFASMGTQLELRPHMCRGKRVHLLGIGGVGMSGIAQLLQDAGWTVSGCDAARSEITDALAEAGIEVFAGHSPLHLEGGIDLVVISAAVRETNPELRAAHKLGLRVIKYAKALGWLMNGRDGIAVSGSHGKTTTTSMIAYALDCAGKNPSMLVGGIVPQLGGNCRNGDGGPFVVEACEYDRSFLSLRPKGAVITNIDREHLDYYAGLEDLVEAFGNFAGRVAPEGVLVVNGDDPNAMHAARKSLARVETFGQSSGSDWRLDEWNRSDGRTRFRATYNGRDLGVFSLLVPGLYNIRNALACLAICRFFGVNLNDAREALAGFRGAKRRFDRLGEAAGVMVLDDYGHHPTEVRVTLDAARQEFPHRRLWCVFQPHQHSRTRILMDDFANSFLVADRVIVPDIYAVRDTAKDRSSVHSRDLVRRLCQNGVHAEYGARFPQVVRRLLRVVQDGDLIMTMGAGPVDHVGRRLLSELRKREGINDLALQS